MTGDPIPEEHFVARHMSKTRIESESGLPAEHAFMPGGTHELSVNWLGYFAGESAQEAQLDCVRAVLDRRRKIRDSCRLALLNVGSAKRAVRDSLGDEAALDVLEPLEGTAAIDVVEAPILPDDPSHAHIVLPELPEYHEIAAAALRGIVRPQDMRPARVKIRANPGRRPGGPISG